jgi:hypothetical protein
MTINLKPHQMEKFYNHTPMKITPWHIGGVIAATLLIILAQRSATIAVPPMMDYEAAFSSYAPAPGMAVRGKMMGGNEAVGMMADSFTAGETAATSDARVIRNASLSLLVDSIEKRVANIGTIAQSVKGYVEHANSGEQEDGTRYGYITIRVPDEAFQTAISAIRGEALKVEDDSITSQDVTEQYTDLQAQIRTAQAEEQAYLGLLSRAGSVSDLLQVQRELSQVRGRIESLQGRINYLENQTDYSTISVNLSEDRTVTLPSKPFRLVATAKEAAAALVGLVETVATALVWLVVVGVPIALVGWGIWRASRPWRRK